VVIRRNSNDSQYKSYRKATELEDDNPQKALDLYHKLADQNTKFRKDVLSAGIIGFLAGFILASMVSRWTGLEKESIYLPLIWYSTGFFIVSFWWAVKERTDIKGPLPFLSALVAAPIFAFVKLFAVAITAIFTILIIAPALYAFLGIASYAYHVVTGAPFVFFEYANMPNIIFYVYLPIFAVLFTWGFLCLVVFDVSIPAGIPIKIIRRVIKYKKRKILSDLVLFFMVLATIFQLYSGNIFYGNFIGGVVFSLIGGALTGAALAPTDRDKLLANLFRIAQASCFVRIQDSFAAYYPLKDVHENDYGNSQLVRNLATAVSFISDNVELRNRKTLFRWAPGGVYIGPYEFHGLIHFKSKKRSSSEIGEYVIKAQTLMNETEYDNYRDFVADSIEKTEKLISFS
jgi:hypothetical protein